MRTRARARALYTSIYEIGARAIDGRSAEIGAGRRGDLRVYRDLSGVYSSKAVPNDADRSRFQGIYVCILNIV
jgi:hypothetical protein